MTKVVVHFGDNGYRILVLAADCEVGAMPPFPNRFDLPVLVEDTVAATEFMAFNAGTHQDVIRVRFTDFARLVNPLIAPFALKAPAAMAF